LLREIHIAAEEFSVPGIAGPAGSPARPVCRLKPPLFSPTASPGAIAYLIACTRLIDLMHLERARDDPMAQSFSFSVILETQECGGSTMLVPALPEVVTEGDTEEEALVNAQEAIRAVLDYRREHGIAIPADAQPEIRRLIVAA
jgi:antitoxin HicB